MTREGWTMKSFCLRKGAQTGIMTWHWRFGSIAYTANTE